ncbi:site-specific DNA-methyltransferase [Candidatus Peregrinibacteria bacterium]|nr:site-specific DNA-methyltransferase [Candidatus Peregrinibacteria bacterium]
MKLTDNEKRDAIKYLEAGKPLPDKYRFLLFGDDREVELVWNGKTSEVTNVVLPFQVIEQIDEPRSDEKFGNQGTLFDTSGRQVAGWTNKLIWGDNKLILSSLKNGPLRKEIEAQGGLKLIYIDPPFDVGADFSMNITIGDEEESFTKQPSVIEEIAYRDTWGKGADSYIAMLYERLNLMRDLLSLNGSIYIHLGEPVTHFVKLICDEIFGSINFINDITWKRSHAHGDAGQGAKHFGRTTESILIYVKNKDNFIWNSQYAEYSEEVIKRDYKYFDEVTKEPYRLVPVDGPGGSSKGNPFYEFLGIKGYWRYSKETMQKLYENGEILLSSTGKSLSRKKYLKNAKGTPIIDLWDDVNRIAPTSKEGLDYPTQKPEIMLERIIRASSNEGDLVADFFCGSGTTLAVAEKLGRKWIGSDLGKFGIHTSRKRLIGVQRELKKEGKNFRAFEILNVGRYERESFLAVNDDLRAEKKAKQAARKEKEFIKIILAAYKAEPTESFINIVGKKRDRLVAVGPIDMPVSAKLIEDIVAECKEKNLTKVDVLGFDYEMGLDFAQYKDQGVDIAFRVIPREVFDKKAVEKGQVKFYDVAFIEVKPIIRGKGNNKELSIELTDFSVFYNQDDSGEIEEALRPGGTKVVVENGKVIKISKDKRTELVSREELTKKWSDWIYYWAVDFDFADRKEIIKVIENGEEKEMWTGDYIFDNEWQSFRTKKNRNLELVSAAKEVPKGTYKVAVKVVDIFGNDTTKVIDVKI